MTLWSLRRWPPRPMGCRVCGRERANGEHFEEHLEQTKEGERAEGNICAMDFGQEEDESLVEWLRQVDKKLQEMAAMWMDPRPSK